MWEIGKNLKDSEKGTDKPLIILKILLRNIKLLTETFAIFKIILDKQSLGGSTGVVLCLGP